MMNWVGTALQERSGIPCSDGAFNLRMQEHYFEIRHLETERGWEFGHWGAMLGMSALEPLLTALLNQKLCSKG